MLGKAEWATVALTGVLQAAISFGVFVVTLDQGEPLARTLAFSTLVFGELFRAFAARSPGRVLFEIGAFTNLKLLGVVVLSAASQLALHHVAFFQELFQMAPLTRTQYAMSIGLGLVPYSILEVSKLVRRRMRAAMSA
jgi:Ca2+-transporting ATPase